MKRVWSGGAVAEQLVELGEPAVDLAALERRMLDGLKAG